MNEWGEMGGKEGRKAGRQAGRPSSARSQILFQMEKKNRESSKHSDAGQEVEWWISGMD